MSTDIIIALSVLLVAALFLVGTLYYLIEIRPKHEDKKHS